MTCFPPQRDGVFYLTEGGQETEIMYRHGHDLPEFAMFPLLDNAAAMADLRAMYGRVLDVAAEQGFAAMLAGLDYRASPDWSEKLGYSHEALGDALMQCIAFLREVSAPYEGQVSRILIGGMIGPRGDAYELNKTITAAEAEDYHSVQLGVLKRAGVDYATAMTFNNVPEAVGVARAAKCIGVPLHVSFTLTSDHQLKSGATLKQAIEATDAEAGLARPDFYGINCSHPLEFEPALEASNWMSRVRMLRPNASSKDKIDLCQIGHLEEGDPLDLGARMGDLARRYPHVDIWGGCCGTWDKHLREIARTVRAAH
ncbi:homocysteine S-methyltransferase family protein [Candidatus Viadribacter manganicus]|uniref:DNA helicase RuvA n=1 Tax=Candidatus Viadribacter manganicus TaxID=1759059 RepID=A0A1B1AK73_9PROT|nr:homocysteine S-methyltransferase family protein [Candidatus Viadribacter manganicus]ANP46969.1 DNA helicase RuvA [Candidatus Viadribacter manganicus]